MDNEPTTEQRHEIMRMLDTHPSEWDTEAAKEAARRIHYRAMCRPDYSEGLYLAICERMGVRWPNPSSSEAEKGTER